MTRTALILIASIVASGASALAQPKGDATEESSKREDASEGGSTEEGASEGGSAEEVAEEGSSGARAIEAGSSKASATGEGSSGAESAAAVSSKGSAKIEIGGYLQPRAGFTYRPDAKPRDQSTYGAGGSRAGIILSGSPAPMWGYRIHVLVGADLLEAVTGVEAIDTDGDEIPDEVEGPRQSLPGVFVEEALVRFEPTTGVWLDAGEMRIPFTLQQQSANTSLLFSQRSGPTEVFLSGTDTGVLVSGEGFRKRVRASLGVFGGSNVSGTLEGAREEGFIYSVRVDAEPLGAFPSRDARPVRGPLRIAAGAGFVYHPSVLFDDAGFDVTSIRDVRLSASVRIAGGGFYAQAEVLRRDRSDDISSRRDVATGAYVQAAFLLPFLRGIAPIGRVGWTEEDQRTDPRTTYWIEGGIAAYLRPDAPDPNALRLLVQYIGEFRHTEQEDAHGGVAQLQMRF